MSGQTRVLIAMCNDKDHSSVTETLDSVADEWLVTEFESPRALQVGILETAIRRLDGSVSVSENVPEAFRTLLGKSVPGDRILVTGFFHDSCSRLSVMNVLDNHSNALNRPLSSGVK